MAVIEKGKTFTFVTEFGTYFVEILYHRQQMSYTVKVYELPPEIEIDLPVSFRFLKIPIDWMVQTLVDEPLIQRTYSISKVRDPQKAVMYTLFAYEFPFVLERQIASMNKKLEMDYKQMAKEYFERNRPKQEEEPEKEKAEIKVRDWQDDE